MPELPEVEVVRAGLQRWVSGRTIRSVEVRHPRAVRRHAAGPADFAARAVGLRVVCASRRGKYLWLPLASGGGEAEVALVGHLGMSGQLLVEPSDAPDEKHLRVRVGFIDDGPELRFVDQRTFGGVAIADLVPDDAGGLVPGPVEHIARDPLDPAFDDDGFVRRVRARDSEVKRILLDQTVASGIGNIYADEALWRSRLHGARSGRTLPRAQVEGLLADVRAVMAEALAQGGTSFDALYVNVNGQSGYFDRSLAAYGQEGEPCARCGSAIRRIAFMNRSSYFCPRCQRAPRLGGPRER
jgi:formamidopyrimidine-DNA glycosylase